MECGYRRCVAELVTNEVGDLECPTCLPKNPLVEYLRKRIKKLEKKWKTKRN